MNAQERNFTGGTSSRIRAEAASWVTRLHGPDRSPAMERGLKRWLDEDSTHAKAFELATEVWQETADLPGTLPGKQSRSELPERPRRLRLVLVCMAIVFLFATGIIYYSSDNALTTGVGERRVVSLPDGSRVELNTSSQLVVKYDEQVRKVILTSGEAYFDVAKHQQRPFVVVAGEREVTAVGTEFLVRHEDSSVSVTLLEGRVAVALAAGANKEKEDGAGPQVSMLTVGQRLKFEHAGPPVLDTPSIEKATAWQRGQLLFEDTPLQEAVSEFNRYSRIRIELATAELGRIRVGGKFRIGDSSSFARAVAEANHLAVIDRANEVLLSRVQESAAPAAPANRNPN
ncbi:MAG: FecR family protein [Gammaproteobacteria bacterium]